MAGLPLKSGADFYNLEASRMRLHNLGADPTEVGAGLIYFNTSTGLNTSQKARLYTGSAWKTIAFSEDLDVASNADFLALKERVDLLSGDVDTDAIISNMKEVSAFLAGFAEDASLMDYLNTELGKKLDLTGGTLSGTSADILTINRRDSDSPTTVVYKKNGEMLGRMGFDTSGNPVAQIGGTYYNIITSAGGTIEGNYDALTIKRNSSYASLIRYSNADGVMGYLGFSNENTPAWYPSDLATSYTLLHSGNVGKYALMRNSTNYYVNLDSPLDADAYAEFHNYFQRISADGSSISINDIGSARKGVIRLTGGGSESQLLFDHYYGMMYYRNYATSSWSDWKQIAFTDSNVASATKLEDDTAFTIWGNTFFQSGKPKNVSGHMFLSNATYIRSYLADKESTAILFGVNASNTLLIGYGMQTSGETGIYGKTIYFAPNGESVKMRINESGNVTIGTGDLAKTANKLYVDGPTYLKELATHGNVIAHNSDSTYRLNTVWADGILRYYATTAEGTSAPMYVGDYNGGALNIVNSRVGIGTKNPQNTLSVASVDFAVMRIHRSSNAATVGAAIACSSDYGDLGTMGWNQPNEFNLQDGEGNKFFYGGKDGIFINTAATVKGDLHVTGNIIADGEVSAGGAGAESGEGGTTGGGGDALIYSQEFTPSTTTVSIAHNLSATKGVIVQVWEKDTIAGTWNMVLVDVEEVDNNNIKLNFGRTETTLHKVVVMG